MIADIELVPSSLFSNYIFSPQSDVLKCKFNLEKNPFQKSYRTVIISSSYTWSFDPSRTRISYWANKELWTVIDSLINIRT